MTGTGSDENRASVMQGGFGLFKMRTKREEGRKEGRNGHSETRILHLQLNFMTTVKQNQIKRKSA